MHSLLRIFCVSSLAGAAVWAQTTRNEITKATTPEQDSKANSADVPDVFAIPGRMERIVVLRFKYDADLLAGMERMVKEQKIKNAVILSGIGSLRNYHICLLYTSPSPRD